jgi:hypothetical protein
MARKLMKEIHGVIERGNRNYWTRIGVAFQNASDGSWNLLFDYLPAKAETTIQLRDPREAQPEAVAEPGAAG